MIFRLWDAHLKGRVSLFSNIFCVSCNLDSPCYGEGQGFECFCFFVLMPVS
jgi:hypothetical protein